MKSKFLQSLAVAAVLVSGLSGTVHAAGSASFSLTPNSGSHVKDSSFTVQVHENGTSVNVVTAKLTYGQAKLSCTGVGGSTAFPNTIAASCSNGNVTISRYTGTDGAGNPTTVSGDAVVGSISFTALADSGTTTVSFASGSQIASNGTNTWNGDTTGGTYTLTAPAPVTPPAPAPTPSNPPQGGSTTPKTTTKPSSNNKPATNNSAVAGETTSQTPEVAATNGDDGKNTADKKDQKTQPKTETKRTNSKRNTTWVVIGGLVALLLGVYLYDAASKRRNGTSAAAKGAGQKPVVKPTVKTKK